MKNVFLRAIVAAVCIAALGVSMTSCGIFLDDEDNFVGLENVLDFMYGEDNAGAGGFENGGFSDGFGME